MKIGKIISVIIIIFLIIGLIIYGFSIRNSSSKENIILVNKSNDLRNDFINISSNYMILDNSEEFSKYIDTNKVIPDFSQYKYIYFYVGYDNCGEKIIGSRDFEIKNKTMTVSMNVETHCGLCPINNYNYYVIKVDKDTKIDRFNINYKSINGPHCDSYVAYKPIIYLYPTVEENITVKLGYQNYLTHTYPKYKDSWNVYAYPDGKLIDNNTGRELYGLYWEGNNHKTEVTEYGFVVKGEDSATFLEEKLSILGLTEREANEFIIYWLPKLEENKYNYIRFESIDEINNYMPLNINPKPDTMIRVLMDYKPLNNKIDVKEQELVTPKRNGFTVVEWGGSLIQ